MKRIAILLMAFAAISASGPALAQAYQCAVPPVLAPLPQIRVDGPRNLAPVRSLTLAVSWSPEYCRKDRDPQSVQCSGKYGRFGFVVHGLWPQAGNGPAPQWCAAVAQPSPDTVRRNLCMTPVPWLIAHEWAKHGSCMASNPEDYYRTTRLVWDRLKWPDADRLSRKDGLTVGDLRDAIVVANPGLRREAIGVLISDKNWLRELRICYARSLRPQRCNRRAFGPPDSAMLKIWRGI